MKKLIVAALILLVPFVVLAGGPSTTRSGTEIKELTETGKIKICRTGHGVTDMYMHKKIPLPAGLKFADVGTVKGPNNGDNDRPVQITSTEDAAIKASDKCTTVNARAVEMPANYKIIKSDGRLFRPCFTDPSAELMITIVSDFK